MRHSSPSVARPGLGRALQSTTGALCIGGLLGSLWMAPAGGLAWGWNRGPAASRVQVLNARGSLWTGQADLVLGQGEHAQGLPQGLKWRLRPSWSAGPGLSLALEVPCCLTQTWQVSWHWQAGQGQWAWSEHLSRWPIGLASAWGAPWNTLQASGTLQVQWPAGQSTGAKPRPDIPVQAQALDIGSRLSPLKPLGSYRLQAQTDGPEAWVWHLSTLHGALQLTGEGRWQAGQWRFRGHAEATPGQETALANLLNLVGRREGPRSLIAL